MHIADTNKWNRAGGWVFFGLLAYMPFHIFLSQWLSTATGGLEIWKIAKDVIIAAACLFVICSVYVQHKGSTAFWTAFMFLILYAGAHAWLWLMHGELYDRSAALGFIYNMRLPALLILGYGSYLLAPAMFAVSSVFKFIIAVSTLVAILGIAQYFLPNDILTHFGYSLERGARPSFFIDDHPELPRIMSTLREPNALGAYLILPVAVLFALLCRPRYRDKRRRILIIGLLGVHLLAIFLTFSRSAWLAVVIATAGIVVWRYGKLMLALMRRWYWLALLCGIGLLLCGWMVRDTAFFQQYIVHSDPDEQVQDLDSNDYHWLLVKEGIEGIIARPFGHGPGTAGLVSIQNPSGGQLTENYYVQIGYELGLAGLVLFLALNVWVYQRLVRRGDMFGAVLCAAFWGYVLTNMLLHTWSNEAVAAQWWILAGLGLALRTAKSDASTKRPSVRSNATKTA